MIGNDAQSTTRISGQRALQTSEYEGEWNVTVERVNLQNRELWEYQFGKGIDFLPPDVRACLLNWLGVEEP